MTDRSPPFAALRAVEAAARHKSFTWAARELNITHSAVSQSIRRLEAELGATLFERKGGAMQPSEAAMRLAQSYSEAAQSLGQTLREIAGGPELERISLGVGADFARLWLAGRLGRLTEAMPDIRVEVSTASPAAADAEIAFEPAPGEGDEKLSDVTLFPVCSAAFAEARALGGPREILRQPLLASRSDGWSLWSGRYASGAAPRSHAFDDSAVMLEAAVGGAGVALTHMFAAEGYLLSGQLRSLPFPVAAPEQLVLRTRPQAGRAEPVRRLLMWLQLEVARTAALLRDRLR